MSSRTHTAEAAVARILARTATPKPTTRNKFLKHKEVSYIGAGCDVGQGILGCSSTPELLRERYLKKAFVGPGRSLSWNLRDCGNLPLEAAWINTPVKLDDPVHVNAKNCHQIGLYNELISNAVEREARRGNFVLTVGGDHSIGFGTVHGILKARPDTVVVWVDAHADINTPLSSPSGNLHGMPVAANVGLLCIRTSRVPLARKRIT